MRKAIALACVAAALSIAAPPPLHLPDVPPGTPTQGRAVGAIAAVPGESGAVVQAEFDLAANTGDLLGLAANGAVQWRASAGIPSAERRSALTLDQRGRTISIPSDSPLRRRLFGAVVRGVPVAVGSVSGTAGGEGYLTFRDSVASRPAAVYVPARDGFLHGVNAANGAELFVYRPRSLAMGEGTHFDASAAVGDVRTGQRWRTVLAGGFGLAHPGIFALDVTHPENSAVEALWEFTDADDAQMGNVIAAPLLARFGTGAEGRDYVVTTSGFGGGDALFLLAADKGAAEAWRRGRNYRRFETSVSDAGPSALAPPALALHPDGSVHRIYAGDLQGNLWRFDFGNGAQASVERLFTARDEQGRPQPITMAPAIAFGPDGGYLVLFGTGRWLVDDDSLPSGYAPQTFYAIFDNGDAVRSRASLTRRSLREERGELVVEGEPIDWSHTRGWFVDLFDAERSGERLLATPVLDGHVALVSSFLPPASGRVYLFDLLTGLPPEAAGGRPATTGQMTFAHPLLLLSASDAGQPDGAGRIRTRHAYVAVNGNGERDAIRGEIAGQAGQLSWRELFDWPTP
ncbi:MAG TPA: PilC/PilY family type IV pilus protein [Telluria sp.]|nr:PilC/PilY family type IV pilus protein [Telluria sp.]